MRSISALGLSFVFGALLGCGENTPATVSCVPACRAEFVCVSGACVEACNPPCGAGTRCAISGGAPMCLRDNAMGDAGGTADAVSTTDLGAPMDAAELDGAAGDAPVSEVSASDVVASDVVVSGDLPPLPPCGMNGQPCCSASACVGGGQCVMGTCVVPTAREMGECVQPSDCPSGQACIGLQQCGSARGCFRCGAPQGMGELGTPCMGSAQCRTGVCSNGRCSLACPVGAAGDAMCGAARAGYVCTNILYRPSPTDAITTIGVCNQSCGRGGDCPSGFVCTPLLNYLDDRMDFVCRAASTTATTPIGGACNPAMPSCQNVLCLATGMGTGYCTGVCQSAMDCPAEAPVCDTLYLIRPSGREQVTRGCHPRR